MNLRAPGAPWVALLSRLLLALVLVRFGVEELVQPGPWVGYLPPFLSVHAELWLILVHGFLLTVTGAAVALGFLSRWASGVAVLLMVGVVGDLLATSGLTDIAVRDLGVTGLALAVWSRGTDLWSLDALEAAPAAPSRGAQGMGPRRVAQ